MVLVQGCGLRQGELNTYLKCATLLLCPCMKKQYISSEFEPVTAQQHYEVCKAQQRAAHRAVCVADGAGRPDAEIRRLQKAADDAMAKQKRAFAAYMHEEMAKPL